MVELGFDNETSFRPLKYFGPCVYLAIVNTDFRSSFGSGIYLTIVGLTFSLLLPSLFPTHFGVTQKAGV